MLYLNVEQLERCIQTLSVSLSLYQAAEEGSTERP